MAAKKTTKKQIPAKPSAKKPSLVVRGERGPSSKPGPAKLSPKKPDLIVDLRTKTMATLPRPEGDLALRADRWRAAFQGALHAEMNPDKVFRFLEEGKKGRFWTLLTDAKGNRFTSFKSFCEAPTPHGLETPEHEVTRFLYEHMSPSAARRLTLRAQQRGARTDLQAVGDKVPAGTRTEQRDWAIARAPEIVGWFKDQGLLAADVAARCGPEAPKVRKKKVIAKVEDYLRGILTEMGEMDDEAVDHFEDAGRARLSAAHADTRRFILADLSATVSRMLNGVSVAGGGAPVYSGYYGTNVTLFPELLRLHVRPGATIADVTFRRGTFWSEVPDDTYNVLKSDLMLGTDDGEIKRYDFRSLPYGDRSLDALVLDPPYSLDPRNSGIDDYGVDATAELEGPRRYADLIEDYETGAKEAFRTLKPNGRFIAKCQDTASQGGLKLTHVDLLGKIGGLGFSFLDMFVLVTFSALPPGFGTQRTARRRHSYFLVFEKPTRRSRA